MAPRPLADVGAGLSTKSSTIDPHPAGPVQHGKTGQVERAFTAASTFFSGMMAISASQFLGAPLKAIDPKFHEAYMAYTKQSFGVLITTMTQWWSPTIVRVSGDKSLPKQLFQKPDGSLECRFPKRIVLMANHQLYTDWLYLWWVAYTNNMHGYIYIILKESLKNVPIIGWGAQFYNFIFLSRKWEQDKKQFQDHLDTLNNPAHPMWLLIFPEGTNLAKSTREASRKWAEKTGIQDMKHQLLPRSRGTQFCLQRLRKTTDWLYDCTIAYEGIPPGEFGQDIFTLRSSMFEGRPPKSVNLHFRRFRISTIPIDNDKAFEVWMRNRWREKDYLLEHFQRFNRFPDDDNWMKTQKEAGRKELIPQPAKFIETQIKSNNLEEFLSIFAPLTSVATVLAVCSGSANPKDLVKMLEGAGDQGKDLLSLLSNGNSNENPLQILQQQTNGRAPDAAALRKLTKMTPAAAQKELIQKYLEGVRPAVASQISLPENALRKPIAAKPNAGLNAQRAKSVGAARSTRALSTVSAGPSAASIPINKSLSNVSNRIPSTRSPSANTAASKSTASSKFPPSISTAPSSAGTVRPSRPISKLSQKPAVTKKAAPPVYKVDKATLDRIQNKKTESDQQTKSSDQPSASGLRGVKIDPSILAKMNAKNEKNEKPKGNKKVTIDPKVLAKMREHSHGKS